MFEIIIINFLLQDIIGKVKLFKKTFLLINISINIIMEISFFIFLNINIQFTKKKII